MEAIIRIVYADLPSVEVSVRTVSGRGDVFTLRRSIRFEDVLVPAGFESDGASVPRALWGLVFPRDDRQAMFAALVHDYLYRTSHTGWTRIEADRAFRLLLGMGGVAFWRANLAYLGVRLFGRASWRGSA